MPSRVIRESLLDSPRYLSVDEGAQLLFNHLMLLADDFGCVSIAPAFIGRRCFAARPSDERLDGLIVQLATADLIRLYTFRGQPFAFIPRFRQRLKRETLKHPRPPNELLDDDFDAMDKFAKLNGSRATAIGQVIGGHKADGRRALDAESHPGSHKEMKEAIERGQRKDDIEGSGSGFGSGSQEEVNPAPAGSPANPVALAAALAEKMRFRENLKGENPKDENQ